MRIIDVNNNCTVYVFCVMDARCDDFVVGIFLKNLSISDTQNLLFILCYSNFH